MVWYHAFNIFDQSLLVLSPVSIFHFYILSFFLKGWGWVGVGGCILSGFFLVFLQFYFFFLAFFLTYQANPHLPLSPDRQTFEQGEQTRKPNKIQALGPPFSISEPPQGHAGSSLWFSIIIIIQALGQDWQTVQLQPLSIIAAISIAVQ